MSKECTEYDIRLVVYDATKGRSAHITFFNDTEILMESERIKLVREDDRLYFYPGDMEKGSIKLSGRDHNLLQCYTNLHQLKDLEGLYDIKYDQATNSYYLDKEARISEYDHNWTRKGDKQLNHNPGKREKRGEYTMTATLKETGQKIVDNKKQEDQRKKQEEKLRAKETATSEIVKALFNLLRIQIDDNEEALATVNAIESYML